MEAYLASIFLLNSKKNHPRVVKFREETSIDRSVEKFQHFKYKEIKSELKQFFLHNRYDKITGPG